MNLPTKLTMLRILMIPLFVTLFFIPVLYFKIAAAFVFILASLTDFLDGYLARKHNQVTNLGKFLDPIADKILVCCALIAVCLDTHTFQIGVAVCTMVILSRELMISGFRIVASSKNIIMAADKLGKIKTVLQMVSLILLIPYGDFIAINELTGSIVLYTGLIILLLATIMTLVSGINYILKNKEILKG